MIGEGGSHMLDQSPPPARTCTARSFIHPPAPRVRTIGSVTCTSAMVLDGDTSPNMTTMSDTELLPVRSHVSGSPSSAAAQPHVMQSPL